MTTTFDIDDVVRIKNERGTFRVKGYGRDGSLTLWGGPEGQEMFRAAWPCRCRHTRQAGPKPDPNRAPPAHRKAGRR